MFTSLRRIIGLGWQNLVRDGGIAVANIFIIMIPILLTSAIFLIKDVSDFLIKGVQDKADITIYFNESVAHDDILKVQDKIKQIPGINSAEYVTKDEALEAFSKRHGDNEILLSSLQEINGNPFLSSINVGAVSVDQYQQVSDLLQAEEYKDMVYKVNYSEKKEVIQKIFELTSDVQRVGLILFAILGVISVAVTFNTVRMSILSRGVEIGIQRLVGASRWFIRGQFLIEGLIFGILSGIFAMMVVVVACWYLAPAVSTLLPGMNLWENFMASLWTLLGMQIGVGSLLGVFSSMIAITRYLKV